MMYRYLPYRLILESPVVISTLGGDPNSSGCLPYIPGSVMRGAMAGSLGDPDNGGAPWSEFRNLILGGKIRWLNAYPASVDGNRRTLPVPLSLCRPKNPAEDESKTIDLSAYANNGDWPKEQTVPLGTGFLNLGAARLHFLRPRMNMRLHHQRDRTKGRAWKDETEQTHGAIFTFESLEGGQEFMGVVQILGQSLEDCDLLGDQVKERIGQLVLMGRSKRAGYGGAARIEWLPIRDKETVGPGFDGMSFLTGGISARKFFRLLFVSDAVLRDPLTGQMSPEALTSVVCKLFQYKARIAATFIKTGLSGAFNRKWRLEIPQVPTVTAGSLLLLEARDEIPDDLVTWLLHEGVGERKAEGFGRVVLLDEPIRKFMVDELDEVSLSKAAKPQSTPPALVTFIERRILDRRLSQHMANASYDTASKAQKIPTSSLLGRLRTAFRGHPERALDVLRTWLSSENENDRLKKLAMEQLEKCRIQDNGTSQSLKNWLQGVLDEGDMIGRLKAQALVQRYYLISEASAHQHLEERSAELKVRFIDSVLSALALRNKL